MSFMTTASRISRRLAAIIALSMALYHMYVIIPPMDWVSASLREIFRGPPTGYIFRGIHRKRASHPTLTVIHTDFAVQAQGMSSSMRDAGQRLTSFMSTSVVQASGSTRFSLQVSRSDAIIAQPAAPRSCPANRAFFLVRAKPRIERSTVLECVP